MQPPPEQSLIESFSSDDLLAVLHKATRLSAEISSGTVGWSIAADPLDRYAVIRTVPDTAEPRLTKGLHEHRRSVRLREEVQGQ